MIVRLNIEVCIKSSAAHMGAFSICFLLERAAQASYTASKTDGSLARKASAGLLSCLLLVYEFPWISSWLMHSLPPTPSCALSIYLSLALSLSPTLSQTLHRLSFWLREYLYAFVGD